MTFSVELSQSLGLGLLQASVLRLPVVSRRFRRAGPPGKIRGLDLPPLPRWLPRFDVESALSKGADE